MPVKDKSKKYKLKELLERADRTRLLSRFNASAVTGSPKPMQSISASVQSTYQEPRRYLIRLKRWMKRWRGRYVYKLQDMQTQ